MNASYRRVIDAFQWRSPDRIPRFDNFWEFPQAWENTFGPKEGLSDIAVRVPDEGAFPTRAKEIKREQSWIYSVDSWGRLLRYREDAFFSEILEVPIPYGSDPDSIIFDSPLSKLRYPDTGLQQQKEVFCVFGKTGGPFLRTSFVRGEEQFLIDIASDPVLAKVLVDKMADHLIAVAEQEIERWNLQDTGVWIYDDMAYNDGPMFSPASFERILLPAYIRMIDAYRSAGARYVVLHSDGNIMPILDMLVEAGIDGLNPLERRAGMHPDAIRKRYPELVLIGGMCNARTLPFGTVAAVEEETRRIIDIGREGGCIIGAHSISPEVPLINMQAYHETCRTYGNFSCRPEKGEDSA